MYIYMQSRIVFNKKNEEKKIVSRIECKYLLSKNKQSLKSVGMVPVRIWLIPTSGKRGRGGTLAYEKSQ